MALAHLLGRPRALDGDVCDARPDPVSVPVDRRALLVDLDVDAALAFLVVEKSCPDGTNGEHADRWNSQVSVRLQEPGACAKSGAVASKRIRP